MTQKQFEQYKERAFDIFCRTVIRHESADAFRELAAKAEREVGLSMLSGQEQEALSYTDEYHTFNLTFLVGDMGIPRRGPEGSACFGAAAAAEAERPAALLFSRRHRRGDR